MSDEKVCKNCRYFLSFEAKGHVGIGDCRRYPPKVDHSWLFIARLAEGERQIADDLLPSSFINAIIAADKFSEDVVSYGVWPSVAQDDMCGEFQERKDTSKSEFESIDPVTGIKGFRKTWPGPLTHEIVDSITGISDDIRGQLHAYVENMEGDNHAEH